MSGPLAGVKVVEVASIGPGPWCAMMLSDMGAEVIRLDRADDVRTYRPDAVSLETVTKRGRRSVGVDLKAPGGAEVVLALAEQADILIEGFRPGVAERLGIGPAQTLARNPRLVYGRITGWGQDGPLAQVPGHDINYLALTGLLHTIGPAGGRPMPPLNLVGDFGGGGLMLAFGVVCGYLEAQRSGRGQVVDAAMLDGATLLGAMVHGLRQLGQWGQERESNRHDGGAPFYGTYQTSDGHYVAVAANEPRFYRVMVEALGLSPDDLPAQDDQASWPAMRARFAEVFLTRTREEWVRLMAPLDTCFAPVLTLDEARSHEHNVARELFVANDGIMQSAPAPRFDRTPASIKGPAARPGQHTEEALRDWGFAEARIDELRGTGAIVQG
ncbi:CoA transferase [Nocardia neocaledoniensis NBRC 108232]|uniref:Alpha-methylacyl-CoA racemase n=1 Tax=Nocardia neocaledoniensis TaxID=236511 RepID=A0A317N1Q0_9NOCA|nr:CaiB/BaiF CoA-transferase family protein [Nocardia neocaledoniensis]PWV67572.1 alpha-methylacyl-CoA racemase [Nocardia neocaledoniensis]GEM31270.1 CoA transferase [Nocardia neocaledoniensis NBRC 108232]